MYIQVSGNSANELDFILSCEYWANPEETFSEEHQGLYEDTRGWSNLDRIKHIEDVQSIESKLTRTDRHGKQHWTVWIPNNKDLIQDLVQDICDLSCLTPREQTVLSNKLLKVKPKPRKPQLVKQDTSYNAGVTEQMVADCLNCLANPLYELGIKNRKSAVAHALKSLKVYHNNKHREGMGGADLIQLNLARVNPKNRFEEYDAFAKDPVIGSVPETDHWDYLLLVVAHEVAHHVQHKYCSTAYRRAPRGWYRMGKVGTQFEGVRDRSHGEIFKKIYRYLRRDLVNHQLGKLNMEHQEWGLTELKYA